MLAAVLAVGVVACGKSAEGDTGDEKGSKAPKELVAAVAASVQFAFRDLVSAFEAAHPEYKVRSTYGSSGNFTAQITNGAPFDVFLSADTSYPASLDKAGLVEPGSLAVYGSGTLALVTDAKSKLDLGDGSLALLNSSNIKHIAIANPKHAPYGRAAMEAFRRAGVVEAVEPKLALGDNVEQAAQFVMAGSAEVGVIALSLAIAQGSDKLKYVALPSESHDPIEHAAVIIRESMHREGAKLLMAFVLSFEGQAILRKHGFGPPTSASRKAGG